MSGLGELGEDESNHEGLDETAKDCLEGHHNHGVRTLGGCLPGAVTYRVLGLQGEQEARGKVAHLKQRGKKQGREGDGM